MFCQDRWILAALNIFLRGHAMFANVWRPLLLCSAQFVAWSTMMRAPEAKWLSKRQGLWLSITNQFEPTRFEPKLLEPNKLGPNLITATLHPYTQGRGPAVLEPKRV